MDRARSVPSKNIPLAVLALSVSFVATLAIAAPARASQLVDRNATDVHLQVNAKGQALIAYRASGRLRRVLGWGAINARPSASGGTQVSFRLDYSGGWGTYHRRVWQTFADTCHRYDGPVLTHVASLLTSTFTVAVAIPFLPSQSRAVLPGPVRAFRARSVQAVDSNTSGSGTTPRL